MDDSECSRSARPQRPRVPGVDKREQTRVVNSAQVKPAGAHK